MRTCLSKGLAFLLVSALLSGLAGCTGTTVINSPYTAQPFTNNYQCNLFGISMNYPADWITISDSLNTSEMNTVANAPTNTLLTSYIPGDGVKTILSDAFYGPDNEIAAPPGQDYIGVAVNAGTDGAPVWQPLTLGISGLDSLQDYQCLQDSLGNTLTFAAPPPKLQHAVQVYYSINMWSGVVNFQIQNKEYADFSIAVMHSPETFEEWSQNIINAAGTLTSTQTTLSGYPAHEIIFQNTDLGNNKKYEGVRVWALINGRIYDVNGAVYQPYQYSDYSALFFQMINSIHISP